MMKALVRLGALATVFAAGVWLFESAPAQAACVKMKPTYGSVTVTYAVPADGTYRVWSRLQAPNKTANSYWLQVDGGCPIVVGNKAIAANTLTWIDYHDANEANKIDVTLKAGPHVFVLTGREQNVIIDRVVLSPTPACVPTGIGDNCGLEVSPSPTVHASPSVLGLAKTSSGSGGAGSTGWPTYAAAGLSVIGLGLGGLWWWKRRHPAKALAVAAPLTDNPAPDAPAEPEIKPPADNLKRLG